MKEILSDLEVVKVVFGIFGFIVLFYGLFKIVGVWYLQSEKIVLMVIFGIVFLIIGGLFFMKGFNLDIGGVLVVFRCVVVEQFVVVLFFVVGILIIVSGVINVYLNLESYFLQFIGSYFGMLFLVMLIYLNVIFGIIIIGIVVMIVGKVFYVYLRCDYYIWYYILVFFMIFVFWVIFDFIMRYVLLIFIVFDIEVFQKFLLGILDVGLVVLVGVYFCGKVKGWMNVENGRCIQKVLVKV